MQWLILDTNFLCWRAFHTTGHLSHNEVRTGVIYGVLRDVLDLSQRFESGSVVFCFDSRYSRREEILPTYKSSRKNKRSDDSEENQLARMEMINQITALRKQHLPRIGFQNVFMQKGYEADDLVAASCQAVEAAGDTAVVISSDHDLFQLIRPSIKIWNPSKQQFWTTQNFSKQYGIHPMEWAMVKAIAGCKTDDVPGIKGVGETTAVKFLTKQLPKTSTKYQAIKAGKELIRRNIPLVELPFEGCQPVSLAIDKCKRENWIKVLEDLGIRSLRGLPIQGRGR